MRLLVSIFFVFTLLTAQAQGKGENQTKAEKLELDLKTAKNEAAQLKILKDALEKAKNDSALFNALVAAAANYTKLPSAKIVAQIIAVLPRSKTQTAALVTETLCSARPDDMKDIKAMMQASFPKAKVEIAAAAEAGSTLNNYTIATSNGKIVYMSQKLRDLLEIKDNKYPALADILIKKGNEQFLKVPTKQIPVSQTEKPFVDGNQKLVLLIFKNLQDKVAGVDDGATGGQAGQTQEGTNGQPVVVAPTTVVVVPVVVIPATDINQPNNSGDGT